MVSASVKEVLKESLDTFLGNFAIHPKVLAIRPSCMLPVAAPALKDPKDVWGI